MSVSFGSFCVCCDAFYNCRLHDYNSCSLFNTTDVDQNHIMTVGLVATVYSTLRVLNQNHIMTVIATVYSTLPMLNQNHIIAAVFIMTK